jgi:glutathione S-transferase
MECSDEGAIKSFNKLMNEHFKTLVDVFLKDHDFCYSNTPTIADLSIAPCLTFIKARSKFWESVPGKVKEYYERVLKAFPETKENFDMLDGMASGYDGKGKDLEPVFDA